MITQKPLSSCCKAPATVRYEDNVPFGLICTSCLKPCSIEQPKTDAEQILDHTMNMIIDNQRLSINMPIFNYERDHSHIHCWNQVHEFHQVLPDCGIPLEKHTQCCLCDVKYFIDLGIKIVDHPPASTGHGAEGKVNIKKSGNGYLIEITETPIDQLYAVTRAELEQIVLFGQLILKTS